MKTKVEVHLRNEVVHTFDFYVRNGHPTTLNLLVIDTFLKSKDIIYDHYTINEVRYK